MPFRGTRTRGDKIIRVAPTKGIDLSTPAFDLPDDVLSKGINFEYDIARGGLKFLSTAPGIDVDSHVGTTTHQPLSMAKYNTYIVVALDDGNLYYTTATGESLTSIGALTGSNRPQFTRFNDKLIIASGDQLQSWDGATLATLSTSPKAGLIGRNAYDNRLIASGDSANPSRVWFSGVGDEDQWDPNASTNPALYEDVRWADTAEVKAIAVIYNDVVVFKGDNPKSITRLTPTSATSYEHKLLALDKGVVTDSLVVLSGEVFFLADEGLHRLSGVVGYGDLAIDPIIGKRVSSLLDHCAADAFLWFNPLKAQLWINPMSGGIAVYHVLTDAFTVFDLGYTVYDALYDPGSGYNFLAVQVGTSDYRIIKWTPNYNLTCIAVTKSFTGAHNFFPDLYKGCSMRYQAYTDSQGVLEFAGKGFGFAADVSGLPVTDTAVAVTDTTWPVTDTSKRMITKRYNRKLNSADLKLTVTEGSIAVSNMEIYMTEQGGN